MSLRKILLIIVVADLVLATIAYFVVFYNTPGTYEVANSPLPTSGATFPSSSIALATTTASSTQTSTIPVSTSTVASGTTVGNPSLSVYDTDYAVPYPVTWSESGATISVMGASLQGNQLTLKLAIAMGNTTQCIPLNVRLLTDEQGDLAAPVTPGFTFPESGGCQGAPGATYTDQQAVFTVGPTALPFFFTTGGTSNIFFQIATTSYGGLDVSVPQKSG